ncbi:methionine synthase [Pseudolabrys taiwanensis]|uniref:Methionine synthase n=2 Tax=Pseudolabrys taiwanensis TaxID=331696 RepID=A0A345ZXV5_9HYPH|nr:methionine synthase [Pseudolabrys taiwanensis]
MTPGPNAMRSSTERILTTHVGSLPRPPALHELSIALGKGEPIDPTRYAGSLRDAVVDIVKKQTDVGIDIVDDGELSKPSFITYINDRLGGFEIDTADRNQSPWVGSREVRSFPDFYRPQLANVHTRHTHFLCTGPVKYRGQQQLATDLANLKAALNGADVVDAFVPATSVSSIEDWNRNTYYRSDEEYLYALADAMHEEYRAIVDAGFLVQVDDPHLVTYYVCHPDKSMDECRKWIALRVDAINHALRGIPKDRVRFHTCYGINFGPRVHDIEVKYIIDILGRLNAGAFSFEAANPRHEHEWTVWRDAKLPDDVIMIPGMITQSNVMVEHPELIAQRLGRWVDALGRERVIAGTDCGFASFAGNDEIHESIVWAKFEALAEGARIASRQTKRAA